MNIMVYREKELEKYKAVWLTEAGYNTLRRLKKTKKKSMMRIIEELLKESK